MTSSHVIPALCLLGVLFTGCSDSPAPPADPTIPAAPTDLSKAGATTSPKAAITGTLDGAKATHLMDARVRAMPPGSPTSGAFFVLHNTSAHDAVVVGGSSPAAEAVELHTHIEEDGQFKMRQVDRIDVPAGQQVTLAPGGLHVMLIGLTAPLAAGDTVSLSLDFEGGHTQAFELPVKSISADGHGGGHGHHGAHGGHEKAGADPHAGHH